MVHSHTVHLALQVGALLIWCTMCGTGWWLTSSRGHAPCAGNLVWHSSAAAWQLLRAWWAMDAEGKYGRGPLGKPGKKPTMWKKIKLLLP